MTLESCGWNERFKNLYEQYRIEAGVPGRVIRVDRGASRVLTNERTVTAEAAGVLAERSESGPPAVGDWVVLGPSEGIHLVRAILPRSSSLTRRRPGEAESGQVVAANVDVVFVVESMERGPNPRRIERAVALAWDGGATPVVLLTKADVCGDVRSAVEKAREGAPYCDVLVVSSQTREGVDGVVENLPPGRTAVLLGPSGVGKSTLTNTLLGEQRFSVRAVRSGDAKGRHTTTARELVVLPGAGCLIDTPGVRELGLWLDAEAVGSAFPEIEEIAMGCRFGDCRHETEPGCAVRAAVVEGTLAEARLQSFLRLRKEVENLDLRRSSEKRHEARARDRSFGKMVRRIKKIKEIR